MRLLSPLWCLSISLLAAPLAGGEEPSGPMAADRALAEYFRQETVRLEDRWLGQLGSLGAWQARRPELEAQMREMLGLDPWPERTDLKPVVTGSVERDGIRVDKLHFQSRPGLYVTANFYRPAQVDRPLPAVLYVCGHGPARKNGVSYGNKVTYQHHGAWFARHGFVCLVIDTLQLGEIEGLHHGTYREGMWWWLNHGYTPAGVEAWNCVRALDYLETRPEVDRERFGVTGRSGGGAYSWWIGAIDPRIKAAVPTAGITDLEDHVVHGCVEGHCDCMYFVNTYGWNYATVAALLAPRALLLANSDRDPIFPLGGVERIHHKLAHLYALHKAESKLGLNIVPGGHDDTQDLQVPAFRWLAFHLKRGDASLISEPAVPRFEPEELKVFATLPADQRNTRIQEEFVALAPPAELPESQADWERQRSAALDALAKKAFRGWPKDAPPPAVTQLESAVESGVRLSTYEVAVQPSVRLRLYVAARADAKAPAEVVLHVTGEEQRLSDLEGWRPTADKLPSGNVALAFFAPRGLGASAWSGDDKKQTQIRRRFYLLGQSLDGMRVYDIRRAVQAIRQLEGLADAKLTLSGRGAMAGNVLYASLFEPGLARLELSELPATHREGPYYLNVSRIWDMPQAVAAAAERQPVILTRCKDAKAWAYPQEVAALVGWTGRLIVSVGE